MVFEDEEPDDAVHQGQGRFGKFHAAVWLKERGGGYAEIVGMVEKKLRVSVQYCMNSRLRHVEKPVQQAFRGGGGYALTDKGVYIPVVPYNMTKICLTQVSRRHHAGSGNEKG